MGSLPACILQQRSQTIASQHKLRQQSIAEKPNPDVDSDDGCGTSLSDAEVGVPTHIAGVVAGVVAGGPENEVRRQMLQPARSALAHRLSHHLTNGTGGVAESLPVVNVPNTLDGAADTDNLMVNGMMAKKVAASEMNVSSQNPVRCIYLSLHISNLSSTRHLYFNSVTLSPNPVLVTLHTSAFDATT